MKTFNKIAIALAFVLVLAGLGQRAYAQTALSSTTTSAAITDTTCSDQTFTLTSTSTMAGLGTQQQPQTVIYLDREMDYVKSVTDSTHVVVQRCKGLGASVRSMPHLSGTTVLFANVNGANPPVTAFKNQQESSEVSGACTASNQIWLPLVYMQTGNIYDCKRTGAAGTTGQWVLVNNGTMGSRGSRITAFCTGTVGSAETEYLNGAACSGATTLTARTIITTNGTLANLRVVSSANFLGTGGTATKVFVNGSATALTCSAAAAATTCSDTTHSVAVFSGDVVAVQNISATSDTAANVAASVGLY